MSSQVSFVFCFWWYLFVCCDVVFFLGRQTFVKMLWCDVLVFVSGWFGIYSIHFDAMGVSTIGDTIHFHWTMGPWSYRGIFYPEKNGGDKESDTISLSNQITQLSQLIQTAKQGSMTSIPWKCQLQKKKKQVCLDFVEIPPKISRNKLACCCRKKKHHLKPNDVCLISYTCNPNDLYFHWKRPCFGGLKPQNRGQTGSRYIVDL